MNYLETSEGDQLSRILHEMTSDSPGQITTHSVLVIRHPVSGETAICWPGNFKLRPHPRKNIKERAESGLSRSKADRIKSKAQQHKGSFVSFSEFLEIAAQGRIRTHAYMKKNNWFEI